MKINLRSFRFRIITTLIVVVSLFSSSGIYFYNSLLLDKINADAESKIENILYFTRNEIINLHDGRHIKPMLKNMEWDMQHMRVFLTDEYGNLNFPHPDSIHEEDTINFSKFIPSNKEVQVVSSPSFSQNSTLAVLKINNMPECYECHDPERKTLGYAALEISMEDSVSLLTFSRAFSITYTISIIIIILIFVVVLHVRFIRKSLSSFQRAILKINNGQLDERVQIAKARELAHLGKEFNQMVEKFQQTQQELARYHERELESAEKLATVGEMAARLAHDVRNPLTGIANSIEIILADLKDSPHMPILQEIRRQTTRVNEAISNLLKYARSTEITMKRGDINELISNLVFFLQNQKQNKDMEISLKTDASIPAFDYDPEQMENVLMNLCYNAIQAMGQTGSLEIQTALDGKNMLISIADNGPGIPEKLKDDIFNPFFTTKTEGTGLGLSIAKEMIKKHCGKIWFENKENGGTIFFIRMPVRRVDEKGEKNTG